MIETFRFIALPEERFAPFFAMGEAELTAHGVRRMTVDEKPGFPCRVSLADAEVGETVVLLSYPHHDVASPYRGSGPIYVRRGVKTARPAPGEVPPMFRHRLLSFRAYDDQAMMIGAEVAKGTETEAVIGRLFADRGARYVHVHNAGPGCYNCTVVRA